MYRYTLTQWMLFFFWYCFLGWIWECFFVSVKQAWKTKKLKFINRGFLHGPVIPIYGFAAISILLATIQVRDNTAAVYVTGALTATLFELVTGTLMERMFKVKYWDYSSMPLNYHGHICLFISLFWGFFAVLLVQVVHVPAESFLLQVPAQACELAALLLTAVFAYDTSISFREAMDLRELLESLTESNETLRRLENRFNAVVAFSTPPEIGELKEKGKSAKEVLLCKVESMRSLKNESLEQLKSRMQLQEFDSPADRAEILEQIEQQIRKLFSRSDRQFLHAESQLRRNPTINSEKHKETLENLKKLLKNRD